MEKEDSYIKEIISELEIEKKYIKKELKRKKLKFALVLGIFVASVTVLDSLLVLVLTNMKPILFTELIVELGILTHGTIGMNEMINKYKDNKMQIKEFRTFLELKMEQEKNVDKKEIAKETTIENKKISVAIETNEKNTIISEKPKILKLTKHIKK